MMFLTTTDSQYREDCLRAENRAEKAEDALRCLTFEVETAHQMLDGYSSRTTQFKKYGHRLLALCERIEAAMETIATQDSVNYEKFRQQLDANAALKSDLDALRESFDRLERENNALRQRK
jgi:predicted outer membrane protein